MSSRSEKKGAFFVTFICLKENFLTIVFHLNVKSTE